MKNNLGNKINIYSLSYFLYYVFFVTDYILYSLSSFIYFS